MFIPDVATRRAAAARLAQVGDAGSIPYLILALQDPDTQQPDVNVSYVAYKALHRLIPSLGPAEGSDAYAAERAAATQPIYDWWQDELLGKHLTDHSYRDSCPQVDAVLRYINRTFSLCSMAKKYR